MVSVIYVDNKSTIMLVELLRNSLLETVIHARIHARTHARTHTDERTHARTHGHYEIVRQMTILHLLVLHYTSCKVHCGVIPFPAFLKSSPQLGRSIFGTTMKARIRLGFWRELLSKSSVEGRNGEL